MYVTDAPGAAKTSLALPLAAELGYALLAVVTGSGMGLVFSPCSGSSWGINGSEAGSASGTLSAVQQSGGFLGVAVLAIAYFTWTTDPAQAGAAMTATALLITPAP